jgi:thiol-disulfide isomerase/thioredoxin
MKKLSIFMALVFLIMHQAAGQDALPPAYLTQQNFPDSVISLPLVKLDSSKTTFGKVLEQHTGKRIIIDLWASWCKDCIVGYPKLEDLMKKVDSSKVTLVFISVDKDDTKWRASMKRFGIRGEHYRTETAWNNTLSNYLVLDWIPRYLVIDEKGKILMPKAITADHADLVKALVD